MKQKYITQQLNNLKSSGLYRSLQSIDSPQQKIVKINGKEYLNFSSNNYLGLANNADIKQAIINGMEQYGVGSGASRFISGNMAPYAVLEKKISELKQEEDSIVFNTGYMANLGIITSLAAKDDIVFIDRLNHASIIDAVRLSGAKVCVYKHLDLDDLEVKIKKYKAKNSFIITDTVFSMDGDIAPLKELVYLAKKYEIFLIVDEAHSFGVFGKNGAGLTEEYCLQGQVDLVMGTFSKAAGLIGGYVSGKKDIIDLIRNKSRPLIYTTALPPGIVCGIIKSVELIKNAKDKRKKLWENIKYFKNSDSQIISIIIGDNEKVLQVSKRLREHGLFVPAIRYPTVKKGTERLRISLTAEHDKEDIDKFITPLQGLNLQGG